MTVGIFPELADSGLKESAGAGTKMRTHRFNAWPLISCHVLPTELVPATDNVVVRYISPARGKGAFAARALKKGAHVRREAPLLAMQTNKHDVVACVNCFRALGSVKLQACLRVKDKGCVCEGSNNSCHYTHGVWSSYMHSRACQCWMPTSCMLWRSLRDMATSSLARGCCQNASCRAYKVRGWLLECTYMRGTNLKKTCDHSAIACGELYCSDECREQDFRTGHRLLCVGPLDTTEHPLYQFKMHALATNEVWSCMGP